MTWEEIKRKFPMYRDEMTESQENEFIDLCYQAYEQEGFSKVFWSQGRDYKERHNQPFEVVGRVKQPEADTECLPMWKIKFKDGCVISAYPDEIIPREMKANGCKLECI